MEPVGMTKAGTRNDESLDQGGGAEEEKDDGDGPLGNKAPGLDGPGGGCRVRFLFRASLGAFVGNNGLVRIHCLPL
jgi:hypothetical protein